VRVQDGWTPLHSAAYHGQKEVVVQLLAKGAAMDAAEKVRQPLELQLRCGQLHAQHRGSSRQQAGCGCECTTALAMCRMLAEMYVCRHHLGCPHD
jgi:ankyrin repeat protein